MISSKAFKTYTERLAGFTQIDVSDDYIHFITLANRSTVPLFDATKQMAKSRVKADGTFDVLNPS